MGEAIGQALSLAVGVALSPVPIIAVILMLVTPRARANGPAFVAGWLLGLAVVGAIVLLLADPAGAQDEGEPATWVGILELALGLLAIKGWMARHNAVILAVLMLVIGAKLLGEGISGLSS